MKKQDEYIWDLYSPEYQAQIKEMLINDKQDFLITDSYEDDNGDICFNNNLHPNWMAIYHLLYKLKPESIAEIGCGGCYHLHNINEMLPQANIFGFDLLPQQVEFGMNLCNLPKKICDSIKIVDFTKEINVERKFTATFTHAVIMHLSTDNAIKFMRNMEKVTDKYIIMVEGIRNHENWFSFVQQTLPEFDMKITDKYIDYGILLTRK